MPPNRWRNLIPPVYGTLVVVAFIISSAVGVVVAVVGGMIVGLVFSQLGRTGGAGRDRPGRAARRGRR